MEPLRLSQNEAVTLLSGLGAFIWVIKVLYQMAERTPEASK